MRNVSIAAAVAVLFLSPGVRGQSSVPNACSLVEPAAVKQILGVDTQPGKAGTAYFAGNTNCAFKLAGNASLSVIVTTSAVQANAFSPSSNAQRFKNSSPLASVGDRAFIWPASANDATVAFLKGQTEVDIRVSNMNKALTPEQLTALAKAAAGKL